MSSRSLPAWSEVGDAEWIAPLLQCKERKRNERTARSRFQRQARLGHFKIMADFDWSPTPPTSFLSARNPSASADSDLFRPGIPI